MLLGLEQFCFPCTVAGTLTNTRKPSPPCATGWSNTFPSPAQHSEASMCAAGCPEGASVEILPLLPPPVFWAVLLQEVRQGWASGACWGVAAAACPQVSDSAASAHHPAPLERSFGTQDNTGSWNNDVEDYLQKLCQDLRPALQPGSLHATFLGLAKPQVLCAWWKGRSQGCRPWESAGEVKTCWWNHHLHSLSAFSPLVTLQFCTARAPGSPKKSQET